MSTRRRLKLFAVGVLLGVGLFLLGGVAVVPAHGPPQVTAQLQPWLQKTMCDYPAVDCTSRGAVVTSPARPDTPAREVR
jgi:hypothetical protein